MFRAFVFTLIVSCLIVENGLGSGIAIGIAKAAELSKTFSTTDSSLEVPFHTDASHINYQLTFDGKTIAAKEIRFNNPNETLGIHRIRFELPEIGNYQLRFQLRDGVYNISNWYNWEIQRNPIELPDIPVGTGEIYGVSTQNPWGTDNKYSQQNAAAHLAILRGVDGFDSHYFDHLEIPPPLLTLINEEGGQAYLYGQAPSKNTKLLLGIWIRSPSYREGQQYCEKLIPLAFLRQQELQSCIKRALGYTEQGLPHEYLTMECFKYFWPWERQSCMDREEQKQRWNYAGSIELWLQHVRIGIMQNGQEIAHFWQEQDNNFKLALPASVSPGATLVAQAKVYGKAKYINDNYEYYDLASQLSNKLTFVKQHRLGSIGSAGKSCNNSSCKVLNVPYINQGVNENGKWEEWSGWYSKVGTKSCGAASAVMVAASLSKLPVVQLKSYVFQDKGQPLTNKRCSRPGAFAVTAYDSKCNQSSTNGIRNYLGIYNLNSKSYLPKVTGWQQDLENIKKSIDRGHPIILSYSKPIGHILVVKGYTYGGQLIVNDPYRDIQNNYKKGVYDYSGKDAIYSLYPNSTFKLNYYLEVWN